MPSRRHAREPEVDPFYDMLFNMLIAFVFCFIVALLAMNPRALKAGDIPAKAEFIITVSWPDMNPNDIDTWVQDPGGNLVWFRAREAGLMHLDRDDRGLTNDTIVVNGIQLKLGLLGKVIGFSILALQIGRIQSFDASQSQDLLRSLTTGLGIALLTTMVGLVGNILLGLQLTRLDRYADRLLADCQRHGLRISRER